MMGLLVDSLKYGNGKDLWNVSKTDGATFTKVKKKKKPREETLGLNSM